MTRNRMFVAVGLLAVGLAVSFLAALVTESVAVGVLTALMVVVVGSFLTSWFRGGERERWARTAVYVVRTFLAGTALISVLAVSGVAGDDFTMRFAVGPVEVVDNAVTVEVEPVHASRPVALCPPKMVESTDFPDALTERDDQSCRQAQMMRAYYGPNAYVEQPIPVRVRIKDPSAGDDLRLGALQVFGWLSFLAGVLAVERMLTAASRRRPFASRNVVWLRVVAISVAAYGLVLPLATRPVASALLERSGSDYGTKNWKGSTVELQPVWSDNLLWWVVPVAIALALFALAEVWRSGVIMRDDVEATV